MNETTTTKRTEFVFRRLGDSFDQFVGDLTGTVFGNPLALVLLAVLLGVVVARVVHRYAHPDGRTLNTRDATAMGVVWGGAAWVIPLLGLLLARVGYDLVQEMNAGWAWYWRAGTIVGAVLIALVSLACSLFPLAVLGFGVVRTVNYLNKSTRPAGEATALALAWGIGLTFATAVVWCMSVYFFRDTDPARGAGETVTAIDGSNAIKWYTFTIGLFALGCVFVALMYLKDTKTVRWYWAIPLALLRMGVYATLCVVFLLPAEQTWEETNKQSRVVILLDISPSVTTVTDETGTRAGRKPKTRMEVIIEFLTDDRIAFLKNLLEKNPVSIYAFGTRLDEVPATIAKGEAPWGRADWEAFARYDFKPFILRGLSPEAQAELKRQDFWRGDEPGTADWAATVNAAFKADLAKEPGARTLVKEGTDDEKTLVRNLELLDRRIEVARTIMLGTNVADSVTAAVNRESANMVRGIVVFSDGRSNLGTDAGFRELRERATREKIPIFTVAVGEDRQTASIVISEVQAPSEAPIDEAWKIIVEADGINMANKEVEVFLDLFAPEAGSGAPKDMKTAAPDLTLSAKLTFAPGDPPHGQAEFVIDPAKLPETLTVESKDAAIKKRVLPAGKWGARARIAKDPMEAFADAEHVRERPGINVVQQKLRILLIAGAPSREFTFLRTLLVREVMDKRATLTTFVQNEAGTTGKLTPEQDETILLRFPNRFDLSNKKLDEAEKGYNLNDYDVILAFDPDWTELNAQQADDLARWVREGGGGLIYIAGPINTFQLARVEKGGPLSPLLEVLPVVPADIVAQRIKPIPKTPRRLYLHPERIVGSDLLKLDDAAADDPIAGWERFFTDRDKYVRLTDTDTDGTPKELLPKRGFFSYYPVERVKPGSAVLAEFADASDNREPVLVPWIVTNNPSGAYRSAFIASGELYKMRVFEPGSGTGRAYFERFYVKLIKYMAAKRNVKAPRGRVLVSKEGVSGSPLRVQARILNESAKPYDPGQIDPKFQIVRVNPGAADTPIGVWGLAARQTSGSPFDGYYAGQVQLDPKQFPPGDFEYRVVIEVPDSAGETLSDTFRVRKSDPEMDNTKPDFVAMLRMASEFGGDFLQRVPQKVQLELGPKLPKEAGVPRLAFKITEPDLLRLVPECVDADEKSQGNRGPVRDLWDHTINFDLTRGQLLVGLWMLFSSALVFGVARGVWALVASSVPSWVPLVIAVLWLVLNAFGFFASGVMILFGYGNMFVFVLSLSMFILGLLAFRMEWRPALILFGCIAGASAVAGVALAFFESSLGYAGGIYPVSSVLFGIVSLLCVEWTARKLLRLA